MKSITQFDQEKDTESLISAFSKLIGLADLSKKVNFKRHSLVSLLMVITWMIKARFARKSLYRCQRAKNFTAKTVRNVLNDSRRRLALIVDDTLMARSCSKKTELLAGVTAILSCR